MGVSSPLVEAFEVTGGNRLLGTVSVTGAKNSVLKLMAAALLAQGLQRSLRFPKFWMCQSWPNCCVGSAAKWTTT